MIKWSDPWVRDQDELEVVEQGRWRVEGEVKGQEASIKILNRS